MAAERLERARERLDERRLALAVRAEQADALPVLDRQRDALDNRYLAAVRRAIAAAHVFHHHHRVRRGVGHAEFERERRCDVCGRNQFHLFERFHTALRLARLGRLRLEAVDEALQMLDGLALLLISALLQRQLLRALHFELRVVAAVPLDLLVFQMQRNIADRIEKFAVVRDHDQRARIAMQPVFEPDDGVEVQVVGRFVEQQQIRAAHQCLGEIQAHAPAARETAHARACLVEREAEAEQQCFGARRRRVAVGVGERGVRFGFGRAVMRGGRRRDACFDRAQRRIAVQRIVERGFIDGGRLLRDVRDLPRRRHCKITSVRVQLAEQHGEQGRFTRAVCAHEACLLAGIEREGGLFEKRLRAARETELVEADHNEADLKKNAILDCAAQAQALADRPGGARRESP